MTDAGKSAPALPHGLKLATDLGPVVVFFAVNAMWGIYGATAAFMVATAASLAFVYATTRRLPVMPLVTAGIVLVFGGLTIALYDETFIKMKPTVVNLLFAAALLAGLTLRTPVLKHLLGGMIALTDAGWRGLTLRWAGFFVFLAVLNEIVWRNVSTDTWVAFKLFGLVPLTFAFAMLQFRFLERHSTEQPLEREPDA